MNKLIVVIVLLLLQSSCYSTKNKAPENPKAYEAVNAEPLKESEVKEEKEIDTQDVQFENLNPISIETFNHTVFNELLQKHVSDQGKVNYSGFRRDITILRDYISSLGANTPKDSWTKEDKLAYWINAYNALTIDLILRNPSIKSIKEIGDPWDQKLWKLGNKYYDLNEIEHNILRKMNEPRIHFAIVCASVSCPKLQNWAYSSLGLDDQLTNAAKDFLNDPTKNLISRNKIKLSKIFKWFAKDFKQDGSLIDFLNKYSDIEISQNASIGYKDYDWNLNE